MRTYVYTERERRIIRAFLEGRVEVNDPSIQQIRSRMKSFTGLSGDVDLYLKLRARFAESVTT